MRKNRDELDVGTRTEELLMQILLVLDDINEKLTKEIVTDSNPSICVEDAPKTRGRKKRS